MKKRYLVVGIVLLFIFMSFAPSTAVDNVKCSSYPLSKKSVIIVDDEGDGDYTSIKEAVNNANPDDTIEVYSGTYYECGIEIYTENVTLKGIPYELGNGSDTGKPFINGEGKDHVIEIKSQRITIDNFRIENEGGTGAYGVIGIWRGADNCLVSHNDISHSIMGCIGCSSDNNSFIKNNISHSAIRQGIVLGGEYNIVSGNIITDAETGIFLWDSNHNTITGNKIMNCSDFGIDVAGSYNKIIGNHLEDNNIGVQIWDFFNSVKCNNFINNELHAQFIYGIPILQRLTNIWFGNYWDRPRLFPYPILGVLVLLPIIIQFDWRPALKPYEI